MKKIDLDKLENIQEIKIVTRKHQRRETLKNIKSKVKRECSSGKRIFLNRKMALMRLAFREKHDGVELRIYKCPECHSWHFTSQKVNKFKTK